MTFKTINQAGAAILLALAITLTFVPGLFYWLFAVGADPFGDFLAKRAGMLFLGLATLLFLSPQRLGIWLAIVTEAAFIASYARVLRKGF